MAATVTILTGKVAVTQAVETKGHAIAYSTLAQRRRSGNFREAEDDLV